MPGRGRPPKPTHVLEMNGSFKHNPARRRARVNEPKTGKLFDSPPPEEFLIPEPETGYQWAARLLKEWNQLALEGPKIEYRSRGTVITLCRVTAEIATLPRGSKLLSSLAKTQSSLRVDLGLTETSGSKVYAGTSSSSDRGSTLAGLAQERRRA